VIGHEAWDELAAGYALHALDPDEQHRFDEHLSECPRCTQSLDEHAFVAAQLGAIADGDDSSAAPSWSRMRGGVLDEEPIDDLAGRRQRYDRTRQWMTAAAAVAVLAGGGVAGWRLSQGSNSTASAISACQAQPSCHVVTLRSAASGATEAAAIVTADRQVTLLPEHLPHAATGRMYVLWQVPRAGRPAPVTTFTRAADSRQQASLTIDYGQLLELAISSEPSGPPPPTPSKMLAVGTTT
jgi:hypothetical protein